MAGAPSVDDYVSGFRDRLLAMQQPGQELVDEPGVVGLIGRSRTALDGRVLVVDDRGLRLLENRRHHFSARVLCVLGTAQACHELLVRDGRLRPTVCTAMVRDDIATIAERLLPAELRLQQVSTAAPV